MVMSKIERQQHQDEDGHDRDYGRKIGLYPAERLGNHLSPLGAVFDGGKERRGCGVRGGRGDLAAELAVLIDAAGEYLVAFLDQHGAGEIAERRAVKAGSALEHDAVAGHALAGVDDYRLADL